MTATETTPETTTTTTDDWDAQFAALKTRFPKVKDSIVVAIHALQLNPGIALDDLKAQAQLHGVRVTASTVTEAQRLLAPTSAPNGEAVGSVNGPAATKPRRTRKPRAAQAPRDVESLIRTPVGKIQDQGARMQSGYVRRCGRRSGCWRVPPWIRQRSPPRRSSRLPSSS